jgi:hypothetical protein
LKAALESLQQRGERREERGVGDKTGDEPLHSRQETGEGTSTPTAALTCALPLLD